MNELHCHKKNCHLRDKNSRTTITLYRNSRLQMFYKIAGVLKGVFKFPQISLEDTCAGYNVDVKV